MYETLMKLGSYRVDYLNVSTRGTTGAFAFTVCGEPPNENSYSASAKRILYTGLSLIQQTLGSNNLVAVYLDVDAIDNLHRPAYQQMKQDLRAGMFRRVFDLRASDLMANHILARELERLYREVGGFDLLTFEGGAFKPVLLRGTSALA
jgi:hypothetical protein